MARGLILQWSCTPPRFSSLKYRIGYPFSSNRGLHNEVFEECCKLRSKNCVSILIRMAPAAIVPGVKQFSEFCLPWSKITAVIKIKARNTPSLTNLDDGR